MAFLDQALGIAGQAARGYAGYTTGKPQAQPAGGGALMKYLRGRQYGQQPGGGTQATPGVPAGQMPPTGPVPPLAPPPVAPTQGIGANNPYPRAAPPPGDPDDPNNVNPRLRMNYGRF